MTKNKISKNLDNLFKKLSLERGLFAQSSNPDITEMKMIIIEVVLYLDKQMQELKLSKKDNQNE